MEEKHLQSTAEPQSIDLETAVVDESIISEPSSKNKSVNNTYLIIGTLIAATLMCLTISCFARNSIQIENSVHLLQDPLIAKMLYTQEEKLVKQPIKKRERNILLNQHSKTLLEQKLNQFVPSSYDLRNSVKAVGCAYNVIDEKLCVGGNWSNVIASTISTSLCMVNTTTVE